MRHYLLIFCLSLIAIFIHGYQFAVSDQEIFIPYILKWQDQTLFTGDLLFNQSSGSTSFFYPLFGFLSNFVNLEILFAIGFLIFQFIFFAVIFRLSKTLVRSAIATKSVNLFAYLSLLPFMLPKFIGGTATSTFETFFGYRSLGILFLLFYLIYLLERKFVKSAVIAGLGFLVHPLSIIASLLLLPLATLAFSKEKLKKLAKIFLILAILMSPLVIAITSLNSFTTIDFKDQVWLAIIKLRDDYLFASTWSFRGWLAFFMYIFLLGFFTRYLKQNRKLILLAIGISLCVFLINFIILEVFKIPVVAQFQLVRSTTPLAYISLSLSPIFLIGRTLPLKISGILAFLSLSLNLFGLFLLFFAIYLTATFFSKKAPPLNLSKNFVLIVFGAFFISNILLSPPFWTKLAERIQFPKTSSDWINLQIWAINNTSKESTFLVPPNQTGFRIFSSRPIVGDIKDGAVVMYSQNYAKEWFRRIQDTGDYDALSKEDFLKLKSLYEIDFLVTGPSKTLELPVVYKNNSYIIYKI